MANTFIHFHRMWLIQNVAGLVVSSAVVSARFLIPDPAPGAVESLLGVLIPCLLLVLALPAVVLLMNRGSPFEVPSSAEAPHAMWRMAKACSLLVIALNIGLSASVESAAAYASNSLLPIILSGWVGINIGNLVHYRRNAT